MSNHKIPIVVGLGFGDEGKGTTTDYLARQNDAKYVVRFSGGSQTAHNVVLPTGEHHTFAQFGSGTFMGAGTIITKHMLVNPFNMFTERNALLEQMNREPFDNVHIDGSALLVTPIHAHANRQREINRGKNRHGSCGEGIGEARSISLRTPIDALRMDSMASEDALMTGMRELVEYYSQTIENFVFTTKDIEELTENYLAIHEDIFQHLIRPEVSVLNLIKQNRDNIVFEGSQGVLLDQVHGFHPNTTWSATTNMRALDVLEQVGITKEETHTHGILRTYLTRHGDGAFPSELPENAWDLYPEEHNKTGRWQGAFRIGMFDIPLMKYAVEANNGVDSIALTHCDVDIAGVVTEYKNTSLEPQRYHDDESFDWDYRDKLGDKARSITKKDFTVKPMQVDELVDIIEQTATVKIMSYGATYQDKVEWSNE